MTVAEEPAVDVINAVAAILTIITSGISIYLFVSERRRRVGRPSAGPVNASSATAAPSKPKTETKRHHEKIQKPTSSRGVENVLHKVAAGFWAVLGFACVSEGATYGEGFLLLLGGVFFWFAYKLWPGSDAAEA